MSPLAAAPTRGYADWQRISNYDSEPLWNHDTGVTNALVISPVLDVSRYAYIGGSLSCTLNQAAINFTWYLDAALTLNVGFRQLALTHNIANSAQLRIPNLGPFLRMQINTLGGGNYDAGVQVFGTNRVHPLEFIPGNQYLIQTTTPSLAVNAAVDIFPSSYYAGPVSIFTSTDAQQFDVLLGVLDVNAAYTTLDITRVPAGANTSYVRTVPPGAWKATAINRGAAADFITLAVQQSMTGAI